MLDSVFASCVGAHDLFFRLVEYNFDIRYKKGKANTQADAISRLPIDVETIPDENDEMPSFLLNE